LGFIVSADKPVIVVRKIFILVSRCLYVSDSMHRREKDNMQICQTAAAVHTAKGSSPGELGCVSAHLTKGNRSEPETG